jgi:hypothetical protein
LDLWVEEGNGALSFFYFFLLRLISTERQESMEIHYYAREAILSKLCLSHFNHSLYLQVLPISFLGTKQDHGE